MKKKVVVLSIIILTAILLMIFKPWGSKPFKELSIREIISVSVELTPGAKTIILNESQINELVESLQTVVIYNSIFKEFLVGQHVCYIITKTDGTVLEVLPMGDLLQIGLDGTRYKTKYEPSEELNALANQIEQSEHVLSLNYLTPQQICQKDNTIFASEETTDHIVVNLNESQVKQFLNNDSLTLDFENLFPVNSATRNIKNSSNFLETLVCYYEYNVPVLNENNEVVSLATLQQYDGKFGISKMVSDDSIGSNGYDFLEKYYYDKNISSNIATYFVEVPTHSNGILNVTDESTTFTFFVGNYGRDTLDSTEVLADLKEQIATMTSDSEG